MQEHELLGERTNVLRHVINQRLMITCRKRRERHPRARRTLCKRNPNGRREAREVDDGVGVKRRKAARVRVCAACAH